MTKWLLPQKMMRGVLYSLIPVLAWAVHSYGFRSLVLVALTMIAALVTEGAFVWPQKKPATEAALVTGALLGLSLPPALPLWMGPIGAVFAIVFGKMVFGGFGMNPFNPAMVGRTFIYLAFPLAMTSGFLEPADFPLGALASFQVDAVTEATPLGLAKQGLSSPLWELWLGTQGGSLGETARLFVILSGMFLIWKKWANFRNVVATLLGAALVSLVLWLANVEGSQDPLSCLLSGGLLFGAFYITTDPISAPRTNPGRWIYGLLIGSITVLIRVFGSFAEGFMFAVLLGNMLGALVDWWWTDRKLEEPSP